MKKVKKKFISWYFNLVDKTEEVLVEFTINIFNQEDRKECCLMIESNHPSFGIEKNIMLENVHIDEKEITAEGCCFSSAGISLEIDHNDCHLKGEISFSEQRSTRQSRWHPGIMGPFRLLPFLQSYHDVISLSHELTGRLQIGGKTIDFTDGRGYIEKEWGKDYPRIWIWAQCNHFKNHDMSMMLGVARMPFLWEYYTSFAVPVYYKGQLEVFASYNGGQIAKLYRYKGYVHLIITQKSKILDLKIYGRDEVELITPQNSHMIRDVYQCDMVKIEVRIVQNSHVILEDVGSCCNLEIGGNTSKLK